MIEARCEIYRRFKTFYAVWWGVSTDTHYRFVGWSRSGYSTYIEMDGSVRPVPKDVLTAVNGG